MSSIVDKFTIRSLNGKDRRKRLTDRQWEELLEAHSYGASIHSLSKEWGISRRAIQFRLYPERLEENKALRTPERVRFYNRNNTMCMRKHREYKRELLTGGEKC